MADVTVRPGADVTVRPATVDDAAAIAAVHVRGWRAAYAPVLPATYLAALDPRERADRWRERLGTARTIVAVDAGGVVGFASFGPSRDDAGTGEERIGAYDAGPGDRVGEVYAIYVDPARWGGGAGQALLAEAERLLAEDAGGATLWVLEGNPRARRFYERAGWRPDGAVKDAEIGGVVVREVRYRRSLPPGRG